MLLFNIIVILIIGIAMVTVVVYLGDSIHKSVGQIPNLQKTNVKKELSKNFHFPAYQDNNHKKLLEFVLLPLLREPRLHVVCTTLSIIIFHLYIFIIIIIIIIYYCYYGY